MHRNTSSSWVITESQGGPLTLALYVRDTLGIIDDSSLAVPPLTPTVPVATKSARIPEDVHSWNSLFTKLLAVEPPSTPRDSLEQILESAPTPELRNTVRELLSDALSWADRRKADHIEKFRRQTHEQRITITRHVAEFEQTLGRKIRPFTLHLTALPVQGFWERQPRTDLLLLSENSRDSPERLKNTMTTALRQIA